MCVTKKNSHSTRWCVAVSKRQYFISFEGMDGCGKDSMLFALTKAMRADNNGVIGNKFSHIWIAREPTRLTEHGKKIARLIRERDVSPEEASALFIADRQAHSRIIEEQLKHSHVLISRYDLSTLAYQLSDSLSFEQLYESHKYNQPDGTLIPDLTFVFDLPPEVAMARMDNRKEIVECFENLPFQKQVRKNLHYCIEQLRKKDGRAIAVINANQPIEQVEQEMINAIKEYLS